MSSADVSPVVARIVNRIQTVANVGLVYAHDLWARDDLQPLLVSTIAGAPTLRAWWVSGPTMTAQRLTQTTGGYQERQWLYTLYGIEGLDAVGDCVVTLRDKALAVADALDLDPTLNSTCHRSWPCEWPQRPEFHSMLGVGGVALVQMTKQVLTISTP